MSSLIDLRWDRWIRASLSSYFGTVAEALSFPFFVEGQVRPQNVNDFSEIRFDGPHWNEVSSGLWRLDLTIAILVTIIQDDQDVYKASRIIGEFSSAIRTDLQMYQEEDNNNPWICITLLPGSRIRVDNFGQVQSAIPVAQTSIEAHYYQLVIT